MLHTKFGKDLHLLKLQHNKKIKKDLEDRLQEIEGRITEQNQLRKYAQVGAVFFSTDNLGKGQPAA